MFLLVFTEGAHPGFLIRTYLLRKCKIRNCLYTTYCLVPPQTHHSHLRFSLIAAYFPDVSDEKKEEILLRWVPPTKDAVSVTSPPKGFYAPYLADVLGKLEHEEDGKDFTNLKDVVDDYRRQEFVFSRVGVSREKASHWTPKAIKELKPPIGTLVWQWTASAFQAYYPMPQKMIDEKISKARKKGKGKVKTMWSIHRGYAQKRTKLKALQEVTKWLWKTHSNNGGDSLVVFQKHLI